MDEAKARQAPHNVAVLVLPECGAVPGDRGGMQLEQAGAHAGGGLGSGAAGSENVP